MITKTPFSATLSIKRSFVRYHEDTPEKEINDQTHQSKKQDDELKSRLLIEQSEKEKLQEHLDQQTANVKTLEDKLRESREELKNAKKEKNDCILAVKSLEKDLVSLKHHSKELCKTMEELENEVKEKANTVKVKDAACMKFKNEKEELEKKFNKVLKEHTNENKEDRCKTLWADVEL